MFYSRFLFLRKVEELSQGLQTIYMVDSDAIDTILRNYVHAMYKSGVMDFRVEHTCQPEHFDDRGAVLIDSEWSSTWQDWDVSTFQFTTGLLEGTFIVLIYRPDGAVVSPIKSMEKYLPEWVEQSEDEEDSED